MVLFSLTTSVLDVSAGVLWWVTKNTFSGVYNGASYLYYGNVENDDIEKKTDEKLNSEIEILTKSINDLNAQIKLLKKNNENDNDNENSKNYKNPIDVEYIRLNNTDYLFNPENNYIYDFDTYKKIGKLDNNLNIIKKHKNKHKIKS